ncbi:hypothetical protein CFI14_02105 [Lactiplantibacillus pentosus]|nr:hypothetical protein CFK27_04960 [Lactiplantibacillus pentosus]AYG39990.1 hypothetical protein CFI14_02105 [Lactiplantibacillus pentosus]
MNKPELYQKANWPSNPTDDTASFKGRQATNITTRTFPDNSQSTSQFTCYRHTNHDRRLNHQHPLPIKAIANNNHRLSQFTALVNVAVLAGPASGRIAACTTVDACSQLRPPQLTPTTMTLIR